MTTNPETRSVSVETDETLRPLLFSIAYRMLGSFTEAEDLVQETLLRVHRAEADGTKVESRKAYGCAVVTRLCIDYLRSARVQREEYVGEWLPEPIVTEPSADPAAQAELSDSLSMAFLVLLERLSPPERAVLLLHDVFGFQTAEVAEIIGKSVPNTRQIAVRARRRVEENKPRFEVSVEHRWILAEKFFNAVEEGDTTGLVGLLAEDAVMYGDGGGKATARRKPTFGREAVARFLTSIARQAAADDVRISPFEVNGQPGAVARDAAGVTTGVMAIDILDGKVTTVRSIVNPDKLSHI